MPIVYLTRRTRFSTAHRLHNPNQSDEWNRSTYGPCNRLHGHNYELFVTVKGEIDPKTGYLIDERLLKGAINESVIAKFDHHYLNEDVDFMKGVNPSMENIVVAIWSELNKVLPNTCMLHKLRLVETENNTVEYFGE